MHTGAVIMIGCVHGARKCRVSASYAGARWKLPGPETWPDGSGGTMSASQIETSAGSALARGRRESAPASLGVG
jgi:hypothetical protein